MTKAISLSAFVAIALLVTTAAQANTEFSPDIGKIKTDSAQLDANEMQGFIAGLNNPKAPGIFYGGINGQVLGNQAALNLDVSHLDAETSNYNNSGKISTDLATITTLNGHTVTTKS